MAVKINKDLCVGCGCCSDVCRVGALELNDRAMVYEEHCVECYTCLDYCPTLALSK